MSRPNVGSTGRSTNNTVPLEVADTLQDVQDANHEFGEPVTVNLRDEANVNRDRYGSVKSRLTAKSTLTVYVYPHDTNPNERKLQVAGLTEMSEALIWTPAKDWFDAGVDFFDIDVERTTITFDDASASGAKRTYRIIQKGRASELGGIHRYFTFSIKRI